MPEQVVQSTAPWAPLQPFLQTGFSEAQRLYNQGGPQYYPNSTVAQFGQDTQNALGMFRNAATQGTAVPGAATNQLTQTLQGDYLNSNPHLDAMFNNAASRITENYQEAVAPQIAANFGLSGRTGSNMAFANANQNAQQALGDSLSGLAANIYGNNYQQERGRQMQAAGMAPSVAPLGYYDASQLLNVGELTDAKAQQNITDQYNRYTFNQNRPYDNLGRYMGFLGGNYGTTTSAPYNSFANNLGLGLSVAGGIDELLGSTSYGGLGGLLGSIF